MLEAGVSPAICALTTQFLTQCFQQELTALATCNERLVSGALGGRKSSHSFQRTEIGNGQSSTMDNRQGYV